MGRRFRVHDLRHTRGDVDLDDIDAYLQTLERRFHNSEFSQTRVYSCRSWRATGAAPSQELHWNDWHVPGEMLLGKFSGIPGADLLDRIEAAFAKGEAVRLFVFDSDAELRFEEVLAPRPVA